MSGPFRRDGSYRRSGGPEGFPRPDIAILAYTRAVASFVYDGAWEHVRIALDPATFTNPDMMLYLAVMRDLAAAMMQCRRGHIEEALISLETAVGRSKTMTHGLCCLPVWP